MRLGEGAGQLGVGEVGDQDQAPVERHGAAEQPLGRLLIGEQAVAQRVGRDARHLELDRVDGGIAAARWSNVSTDSWWKRVPIASAISCSSAPSTRSTSKRRERSKVVVPESEEKKTPSSSSEPRGAPPPVAHDPGDGAREAAEPVVEPRVVGVGDHRGVVGREDLGVGDAAARHGRRPARRGRARRRPRRPRAPGSPGEERGGSSCARPLLARRRTRIGRRCPTCGPGLPM